MSIFDEDVQMNRFDNKVLFVNPLRGTMPVLDYAKWTSVYAEVMISYIDFFNKYWRKNNVNETNKLVIEELERVGIAGWNGLTEKENNPLGEYVMALDCPATVDEMKAFFKRVMMGDLEFLCRYPIGDSNAYDMIDGLGINY